MQPEQWIQNHKRSTDVWDKFIPPLLHGRSPPTRAPRATCDYLTFPHTFPRCAVSHGGNMFALHIAACAVMVFGYNLQKSMVFAIKSSGRIGWAMRGMREMLFIGTLLEWYRLWGVAPSSDDGHKSTRINSTSLIPVESSSKSTDAASKATKISLEKKKTKRERKPYRESVLDRNSSTSPSLPSVPHNFQGKTLDGQGVKSDLPTLCSD